MTDAGEVLRRARARAGLSQRALAERAGVPQAPVSRIETGREQPTLARLAALVAACGQTLRLELEPAADPHDLGLLETTLALTPEQRVDRLVALHETVGALRRAFQEAQAGG